MPSASNKTEQKASKEAESPIVQVLLAVEKKVRNLEKRKGKLDVYKDRKDKGEILNKDQEDAVGKYESVTQNLEFAKELQKQFLQISADIEKQNRKQKKRDAMERQNVELRRVKEMLQIQNLLDCMGSESARADFTTGKNGACVLTEANLKQLDDLYKLINPSREEEGEFEEQLEASSQHIVDLLDGKDKPVLDTTYKELREVFNKIHESGYFDRHLEEVEEEAEAPEESSESSSSEKEFVVVKSEEVPEHSSEEVTSSLPPDVPEPTPQQLEQTNTQQQQQQNADQQHEQQQQQQLNPDMISQDGQLTNVAAPEDAFFATGPSEYIRSRPFNEIVSSVQGNYNFLQDSEIDVESPHMDPAVVAAQPMVSHMAHPSQQRTETTTGYVSQSFPDEQTQQQPQPSQQQQQQTYASLAQQSATNTNYNNQQTFDNTYNSSQTDYSQMLSQNLPQNTPSLHENVDEQTSNLVNQMAHTTIGGVTHSQSPALDTSSLPPAITMPSHTTPYQSQTNMDQSQTSEMNASAPVFQSMYSAKLAGGSTSTQPPTETGTFTAMETSNFSANSSGFTESQTFAEVGKFEDQESHQQSTPPHPSTEFPETGTFDSSSNSDNSAFNSNSNNDTYSRGSRGGSGYRGGPRGGRGGNMSNGYSNRGGSGRGGYQSSGDRGDRDRRGGGYSGGRGGNRGASGTYQGYPPRSDYRPEGYQGFSGGNNYNNRGDNANGGYNSKRGSGAPPRGGSGGMRGGAPRGNNRGGQGGRGGFGNSGRGSFAQKAGGYGGSTAQQTA
ncbi:unnamed protein product [Owenia fusiformis]|uniref:Caprin-1 dimerization domain-containing protein n=1 Tax=Owenia fusiformis TaxID=6347 RepID=A0A8S4P124_OWEFU|nr:unnamed protein product [Owenia fusiformis]